jgi:hypothetical protein
MPPTIEETQMSNRYRYVATGVLIPFLIGASGFFDLTQRPRFASFHTVDVIQLLASGMCFGIALTGLIDFLRKFRTT